MALDYEVIYTHMTLLFETCANPYQSFFHFQNYAAALKENVILKTRLKRSNNEVVKKDRQLQNLLFIQVCCLSIHTLLTRLCPIDAMILLWTCLG